MARLSRGGDTRKKGLNILIEIFLDKNTLIQKGRNVEKFFSKMETKLALVTEGIETKYLDALRNFN